MADKTIAFVTNQYSCDRIINAARKIADDTDTTLVVVGVLDSEYQIDPKVVDYLFVLSKKNKADMRLLFAEDKLAVMIEAIADPECANILTGMPNSHESILYTLWKMYPTRSFFTVDLAGEVTAVQALAQVDARG